MTVTGVERNGELVGSGLLTGEPGYQTGYTKAERWRMTVYNNTDVEHWLITSNVWHSTQFSTIKCYQQQKYHKDCLCAWKHLYVYGSMWHVVTSARNCNNTDHNRHESVHQLFNSRLLNTMHTYMVYYVRRQQNIQQRIQKHTLKHKEEHNTQKDKKVHETEL